MYFDIDADDIVKRVRGVILHFYKPEHFRNNVMGPTKTNELKGPDLYGPFWITMSLIFFIGVSDVILLLVDLFYFVLFCLPYLFIGHVCICVLVHSCRANICACLHND